MYVLFLALQINAYERNSMGLPGWFGYQACIDLACIFMGMSGQCGSAAAYLEAGRIWTAPLMCDPPMQVNPPLDLEAPAWSRAYEFCVWLICFLCHKKLS